MSGAMATTPVDRRVRKTKQALRQGLAELLREKPIRDIRVRELVERVDISRGTFYLHYRDIYDLLEQVESEMGAEILAILKAHAPSETWKSAYGILVDLFAYLAENAAMCTVLLGPHGDMGFINRLKGFVKENCLVEWGHYYTGSLDIDRSYFYSFVLSAWFGLFETWLETGMRESPEAMATLAEALIQHGVKGSRPLQTMRHDGENAR